MAVPHYTSNPFFCHKLMLDDNKTAIVESCRECTENYSNRWEAVEPAETSFVPAAKLFPLTAGMSVCVLEVLISER